MVGLFSLFIAAAGTLTGEAWSRHGPSIYRDERPREFWCLIAAYYFGGALFIGYFLYRVYGPSN
jgi:hypothetical protein